MDKEEFIQQYRDDWSKTSVLDIVYGDLVEYCREKGVGEEDISTDELVEVAEELIERGEF